MHTRIDGELLARKLESLPLWEYDSRRAAIYRRIVFADFVAAFAAMTRIAFAAENMDHHPEWFNVYNRLEVWLTTHDVDGVSERDLGLARLIDVFAGTDHHAG